MQGTIIQLVWSDLFKPVPTISAMKTPYPSRLSIPAFSLNYYPAKLDPAKLDNKKNFKIIFPSHVLILYYLFVHK